MRLNLNRGGLFLALAALALPALAQTDVSAPAAPATVPDAPAPSHRGRGEQRLKDLQAKLGLTDAQLQQVRGIMKAQMQQGRALHEDDTLSDSDRQAKMAAIMKAAHDQVRAILTPDQQKIFDAMPPPGMGRHGGPGGPPPADGNGPPAPPPLT